MPLIQAQHTLLTKSICHRLNHLWRLIPTINVTNIHGNNDLPSLGLKKDSALRQHLQSLFPTHKITDRAWTIATFPPRLSGMGISTWQNTADCAFLASYTAISKTICHLFPSLSPAFQQPLSIPPPNHATLPLPLAAYLITNRLSNINPAITDTINSTDLTQLDQPTRHLQHKLSNLLLTITHEKICNSASTRDKAQLLSNQGNSSIWSINPSSSNLLIPNSLYKINVARTLLISITKCNCKVHYCPSCHKKCDPYGDHSLLCYADGNPTRRSLWHDQLTRTMSNYMYCHGIPCSYEPRHIFPDTDKRPDLIAHWPSYSVAFDTRTCVACKDPPKAASQKGYAANQGSLEKHRNWDSISIANTLQILPLSIEDGGTMHPEFAAAIKHIAQTSNDSNPGANRISRTYWTQRILVANAKGVAHTIINHMPTCRNNSCKCNKEVHQPTLIPIQRNAHYNSNAALQATNTTVPTVQHTSVTSLQPTNQTPQISHQSQLPTLPYARQQQMPPTPTSIWAYSVPNGNNRYMPLPPTTPSANPQPPAFQFPPYPCHHQYSSNHDVHLTPTSQNHIHRRASSTIPCQTLHPPTFMNDLSQNPQHHHQQQSSDLNISSCNISRNDPIISANDSYWPPNISYCTMSGERIPFQCSGDLGLSHNTPCNQASLPFQSSFFECASSQFSQRQSQNKKNNNKPLV